MCAARGGELAYTLAATGKISALSNLEYIALCVVGCSLVGCSLVGCSGATDELPDELLEQQAQYGWGTDRCPEASTDVSVGFSVGDQLDELVMKSCDGVDVSLRELCGADALWISTAHAWCPHCRVLASFAEEVHDSRAANNLASVHILIEWNSGEAADADHCDDWRDTYGHDDVITLYDPNGDSLALFEEPYTALNVFVDPHRVIDRKLHTDIQSDVELAIDLALDAGP